MSNQQQAQEQNKLRLPMLDDDYEFNEEMTIPEIEVLPDIQKFVPNTYEKQNKQQQVVQKIKDALNAPFAQPEFIQNILINGVPDETSLRYQLWQYALQYLSPFSKNRKQYLYWNRRNYRLMLQRYMGDRLQVGGDQLQQNIKDMLVHAKQIYKDVMRTEQHTIFFSQQYTPNALLSGNYNGLCPAPITNKATSALFRILFILANVCPTKYVQGMNELTAQILVTFCTNSDQDLSFLFVEADVFWCTLQLLSRMGPFYMDSEDNTNRGVMTVMKRLEFFLEKLAPKSLTVLQSNQIMIHQFAMPWINSLFAQCSFGPQCERLWDSIFAIVFFDQNKIVEKYGYTKKKQQEILHIKEAIAKILPDDPQYNAAYNVKLRNAYLLGEDLLVSYDADIGNFTSTSWIDFFLCICVICVEIMIKQSLEKQEKTPQIIKRLQENVFQEQIFADDVVAMAFEKYKQIRAVLSKLGEK